MPQLINRSLTEKARKEHTCNYCNGKINVGEPYIKEFLKESDYTYQFKMHPKCMFIANELYDWFDPSGNGIDSDGFSDMCHSFLQDFVCPNCEKFNKEINECDDDLFWGDCYDKIVDTLKKYEVKYFPPDAEHKYPTYRLVERPHAITRISV